MIQTFKKVHDEIVQNSDLFSTQKMKALKTKTSRVNNNNWSDTIGSDQTLIHTPNYDVLYRKFEEQSVTIEALKSNQLILRKQIEYLQSGQTVPSSSTVLQNETKLKHLVESVRLNLKESMDKSFDAMTTQQDKYLSQWFHERISAPFEDLNQEIILIKREISKLRGDMMQAKGSRSVLEKVMYDIHRQRNFQPSSSSAITSIKKDPIYNADMISNHPELAVIIDLVCDKLSKEFQDTKSNHKKYIYELKASVKKCEQLATQMITQFKQEPLLSSSLKHRHDNGSNTNTHDLSILNQMESLKCSSSSGDDGSGNSFYNDPLTPHQHHPHRSHSLQSEESKFTPTNNHSFYPSTTPKYSPKYSDLEHYLHEENYHQLVSKIQNLEQKLDMLPNTYDDKINNLSNQVREHIDDVCTAIDSLNDTTKNLKIKIKNVMKNMLSIQHIRETLDQIIDVYQVQQKEQQQLLIHSNQELSSSSSSSSSPRHDLDIDQNNEHSKHNMNIKQGVKTPSMTGYKPQVQSMNNPNILETVKKKLLMSPYFDPKNNNNDISNELHMTQDADADADYDLQNIEDSDDMRHVHRHREKSVKPTISSKNTVVHVNDTSKTKEIQISQLEERIRQLSAELLQVQTAINNQKSQYIVDHNTLEKSIQTTDHNLKIQLKIEIDSMISSISTRINEQDNHWKLKYTNIEARLDQQDQDMRSMEYIVASQIESMKSLMESLDDDDDDEALKTTTAAAASDTEFVDENEGPTSVSAEYDDREDTDL